MRFASLGSGSRGNSTLVEWAAGALLIDCGFSLKETEQRLLRLSRGPEQFAAILVTQYHSNQIRAVPALARRYQIAVSMPPGTVHSRNLAELPDLRLIHAYTPFEVNGLTVRPVAVPHAAREPAQFVLEFAGLRLG